MVKRSLDLPEEFNHHTKTFVEKGRQKVVESTNFWQGKVVVLMATKSTSFWRPRKFASSKLCQKAVEEPSYWTAFWQILEEANFPGRQKLVLFVAIKTTTLPCRKSVDSTTLVCQSFVNLTTFWLLFHTYLVLGTKHGRKGWVDSGPRASEVTQCPRAI